MGPIVCSGPKDLDQVDYGWSLLGFDLGIAGYRFQMPGTPRVAGRGSGVAQPGISQARGPAGYGLRGQLTHSDLAKEETGYLGEQTAEGQQLPRPNSVS